MTDEELRRSLRGESGGGSSAVTLLRRANNTKDAAQCTSQLVPVPRGFLHYSFQKHRVKPSRQQYRSSFRTVPVSESFTRFKNLERISK